MVMMRVAYLDKMRVVWRVLMSAEMTVASKDVWTVV